MMKFADVLGYCFRKRVALAIEHQSLEHDVTSQLPPSLRDAHEIQVVQRPWAGGGQFDELCSECPFDFTVWFLSVDGERIKIRNAMDVSRVGPLEPIGIPHGMRADIWWRGSIVDVWLKTSMLTFNRTFPHEINRFVPTLCSPQKLSQHLKFALMFGLGPQFSQAYIEGLSPPEQSDGSDVMRTAKKLLGTK